MATMNPNIILAGRQPDFANSFKSGVEAARMVNDTQRQNALANLYRTQGAGIASGERSALNALAAFDPMQALKVQDARLGMDATRQNMDMQRQQNDRLDAQERRAVENHVSTLSARQRAEEAKKIEDAIKFGMAIPDAQAWDTHMGANPDTQYLVGQFDQRQGHANRYLEMVEILKGPGGNTEADREIGRLTGIGIPYDVAVKIKEGVYRAITDPLTRETVVIDLASGQPVHKLSMGDQSPGSTTSQAETPQLSFGTAQGDASQAFGIQGAAKGLANSVADAAGFDTPYQGVQNTQADFAVLREAMINDVASAYDRQPPSWLLKNIEALTPEAGKPFSGPSGAQAKLRSLKRNFERELNIAQRQSASRMSPSQREKVDARILGLGAAIGRVESALERFNSGEQKRTSSGITWSVEE